jgi:hypothetical protein
MPLQEAGQLAARSRCFATDSKFLQHFLSFSGFGTERPWSSTTFKLEKGSKIAVPVSNGNRNFEKKIKKVKKKLKNLQKLAKK